MAGQSFDYRDEIVEDFLEGQPRAAYWTELAETLRERLHEAIAARDAADPEDSNFTGLEKRVQDLRKQVGALAEEAAITQFVEDAVHSSLSRPRRPGVDFADEE